LHLFGRRHAFAYQQEVDGNAAQRHHVRFWPVPQGWILPGGHRVGWVAAGTYDRSVGLSAFTGKVTHKIDADIDIERDYIVNTVRWADPEVGVRVIRDFSTAYHHRNGGGDLIRTDGHLPILDVSGAASRSPAGWPTAPAPREHALPPAPLLAVSALWLLQVAALALVWGLVLLGPLAGELSGEDLISLAMQSTVAGAGAVLCLCTIARFRWARLLLMLLCAGQTIEALATTVNDLSASTLVSCSISLLVLLAISSDQVRTWVSRGRRDPRIALP
ncbi:MAG: LssY C-terminal domain-containing protein, partial [Propionibacteriaceae bacterium]|nr:LssY C-terminal domain-containing protein [Propionibacteriaceae bacterium]